MADEVKLKLTLGGDASGAEEALEEVRASAEAAAAAVLEVSGTEAVPGADSSSLDGISSSAEAARSAVEGVSGTEAVPGADATSLDGIAEAAEEAREAVEDVAGEAESLEDAAGDASEAVDGASDALEETAEAADGASDALEETSGALNGVGAAADRAKSKTRSLYQTMQKEVPSLDKLKKAVPLGGLIASGLSAAATACKALAAAAAAAGTAAAVAVVKFGAQQEQTRLKMQVLLGDAAKGNRLMAELGQMANATPFSNSEVVEAGQSLLSYGVAAGDVQRILTQVGNAAAATGRPLGQMAEMYGKAMAKGKADSETLNQMAGAGVPILQALAAQLGVTKEQVYELASKGQISAGQLAAAFGSLSEQGGSFNGMMERQSQTVGGLWSTLTGKLQQAAATLGEQLAPVMRKVLEWAISFADRLSAAVSDGTVVRKLGEWAQVGVAFFMELGRTANTVWQYIKAGALTLGDILSGVFHGVAAGVLAWVGTIQAEWAAVINGFIAAYNEVASLAGFDQLEEVHWGDSALQAAKEHGSAALDAGDRIARRFPDANAAIDDYNRESEAKEEELSRLIQEGVDGVLKSIRDDAKAANEAVLETGGQTPAALPPGEADEVAEPIAEAVEESLEKALGDYREKGEEARMGAFEAAGVNPEEERPEPAAAAARAPGETPVDSLAKIGLYNFGASADRSLDTRRNQLLEQIARGVSAPQASRMEVFAV